MYPHLQKINSKILTSCGLEPTAYQAESESQEYEACRFKLNHFQIISRKAKITPKKSGQFVTFWKRDADGPIAPIHEFDLVDYFMVYVQNNADFGLFIIPKAVLIKKGILSTLTKEGKRAFRIYPPWDKTSSKQAERSQKWQLDYFYSPKEISRISQLFITE